MGQLCLFSRVSSNDLTPDTKNLGRTERDPLISPNSLMDLKLDPILQYSCLGPCSRSDPLSWTLSAHHFWVPGTVSHQVCPDTCSPQCLPRSTLFPDLGTRPSFFPERTIPSCTQLPFSDNQSCGKQFLVRRRHLSQPHLTVVSYGDPVVNFLGIMASSLFFQ